MWFMHVKSYQNIFIYISSGFVNQGKIVSELGITRPNSPNLLPVEIYYMFKKPYSKVYYVQPFPRCQIIFPWFPQSQGQILLYPDHNCGIEYSAEMH